MLQAGLKLETILVNIKLNYDLKLIIDVRLVSWDWNI